MNKHNIKSFKVAAVLVMMALGAAAKFGDWTRNTSGKIDPIAGVVELLNERAAGGRYKLPEGYEDRGSPPPNVTLPADYPRSGPKDFSAAKRILRAVHQKFPYEVYCGCKFNAKTSQLDESCPFVASSFRNRSTYIEWEHVVPASDYGRAQACWRDAPKGVSGREHCRDVSDVFRVMEADPYNLLPAIGSLNAIRSNHRYGEVPGEARNYGTCDYEYQNKRVEPPAFIKGDVARVYFYMEKRYGHPIGAQQQKLFSAWAKQDPVDDYERKRARAIAKVVGWSNPFVENQ